MEYFKIGSKIQKVAIFGDLHLDDNHKGRHKNYLAVCFWHMREIEEFILSEKPDAIVFLGDMFGVRSRIIKNRAVLLEICKWFERLNTLCNNNIYVVKGNHDFGQNPEFDFLHGLGYFKIAQDQRYLDITNDEGVTTVRFHLVNYGQEKEPIDFCHEDDVSNVVLFHNDVQIPGKTTWYKTDEKKAFDLSQMTNWEGCDMAIGGHIHNPSPYFCETEINGKTIHLFYVGNATRPTWEKNIYEFCWNMVFSYNSEDGEVDYDAVRVGLLPVDEVFYTDTYIEDLTDEEINENLRKEDLHSIVKDLIEYRIADGDPIRLLETLPNTKPRAVEIAKDYVEKAFEQRKLVTR